MANIVIAVVLAGWAGNIVAGIFQINGYQSSESINGVFTATIGLAFALRAKAKDRNDDDKAEK